MEAVSALAYAERELAGVEAKAQAWRRIVEGLRGLNGDAPKFILPPETISTETMETPILVPAGRPKGMDAVRRIVSERPGRWTLRELHEEFERRDWFHTDDKRRAFAAVDAAAWRMAKLGHAEQVEPGVYVFPAPDHGADDHAPRLEVA